MFILHSTNMIFHSRLNRLLLITFTFCFMSLGKAQLVTSTLLTPQQLVQNVLIGTGVNASNITFTGASNAIGSFDGSNCNVGIGSGVILTTGTVLNSTAMGAQEGPFGPNDNGGSGVDNNQPGEPLLAALAGNTSFNAAVLEFDFVPQSDTIKFNFVFGSEEYLEFVNAGVNDAFGFFITGPDPGGGNFTDKNIALIPGTTIPVTIDNLNSTVNAQYYIDNGDGATSPQNGSNTFIQYDGLTQVLEARSPVICGSTYHIVIAISDIGDGVLDSGVFLEAGSFTSPGIDISSNLSFQGNTANDSTLIEGCGSAEIWFVRNDSLAFSQTLPLTISGTAIEGIDYNNLPPSITFPAGQDSVSLTIDAYFDSNSEPLEYLQILVELSSSCANATYDSLRLYIQNIDSIVIDLQDQTINCPGDSVTITPTVNYGSPGYSYLWSNGVTTSTITVSPTSTTVYTLTVTDTCGLVENETVTVTVPVYTPLILSITPSDTIVHCLNSIVTLNATTSGGGANQVITWSNGSNGPTTQVTITGTIAMIATATDECGNSHSDTAFVTLQELPITTTISQDTSICSGNEVTLYVTATGGFGNSYDFSWSSGQTDSIITVSPTNTTQYIVEVSDACGYVKTWDTVTVNIIHINANFIATGILEEGIQVQFQNLSVGAISYNWDLGNGETSTLENPSTIYESSQNYIVTLIATNDQGCQDSITKIIQIKPEFIFYAPNSFTPDGDEFNQTWIPITQGIDPYNFDLYIYNRWGQLIWESHDITVGWDGTYDGQVVQTGTYVWMVRVKLPDNDDSREFNGTINLIK